MRIPLKNQFYIVRHGKAQNNVLGIESCKMDTQKQYGLVAEGRAAVEEEAAKYDYFDVIFSSPFRRTQETAKYFSQYSDCEIFLDERLVDVDLGELDQKTYEESRRHSKENSSNDYIYPGGESFSQALERLKNFIQDINQRYDQKKILIVSHGFPCETLLDWFAGRPLKNWDTCIKKAKVFSLNQL